MKRAFPFFAIALVLTVGAGASNRDVNRDGRVDEGDTRALARMIAGLDPANLAHDLDGDGELTLQDVNLLLDSYEPQVPAADANGGPEPALAEPEAATTGGLAFFAIRQKATGDCIVVAGDEGISPGDTVYGVFPDFQSAQGVLVSRCATNPPTDQPKESATNSLLASPILAVPKYDNDDSTEGIFFVSLETGNVFFIDKVKSSPRSVRTRTLNQNVFQALGRSAVQRASHGEILVGSIRRSNGQMHALLLVDTTTGAMAYISGLDDRSYEGILRPIRGKPSQDIAAADGDFALVMRQDSSGKTDGAFVLHGPTGACMYFEGVGDLDSNLMPHRTPTLPAMGGGVSAIPIQADNESTSHMVLVDHGHGSLHHVALPKKNPWELEVVTLFRNVYETFPKDGPVETPHRFVNIAISSMSGATESAIVVDVVSGGMLLLDHIRDPEKVMLVGVNRNIYEKLPEAVPEPRILIAVPKVGGSGATQGAWLFDSVTGGIVFLENLQQPGLLEIRTVEERTR